MSNLTPNLKKDQNNQYNKSVMEIDNAPGKSNIIPQHNDEKKQEITQNYLAGLLSFSEYASQMEEIDSDADDDGNSQVARTETDLKAIVPSTSTAGETEPKQDAKRMKIPRMRRVLPPTLKGLMGEANLRYARGDYETAEKMCLEIIRQVPTAPDPFLTLAQMYESDNVERSIQFALIAAYLNPNDDGQWTRLARLSEQLNKIKQADTCYAKAIAADLTNIPLHMQRIKFLETHGDERTLRKAKMRALMYMTSNDHAVLIPMATELTKAYHAIGHIAKAFEAMDFVFKKCPAQVTSELVNIMLELLLSLNNYKYCLEIFVQYCNIDLEIEVAESEEHNPENIKVLAYHFPIPLPIDLHIKFIICLVYLKSFEVLDPLLSALLCDEDGVENNGDLYLDVAEALMAVGHHQDALKLLVPLVKSKNFGMAAVWLRHAECLNACGMREQAINSYKKVMELAPQHLEMRQPLAELLIGFDRKSEALSVLDQDETCEEIDAGLLFKRCQLLKDLKLYTKYWAAGLLLLSRHCCTIRDVDEVDRLIGQQGYDRKVTKLKMLRMAKGEIVHDPIASFTNGNEPNVDDEYALLRDLVESCMKRRRYDLMQRFAFTALSSKRFKAFINEIILMATFACIYNEDSYHGYNLVRDLVQHNLGNKTCWNLYNLVIQRSDDGRHNRFLMRLLSRVNVDPYINVLHGNNCLVAGTYKYALNEYITLYRSQEDPLCAFLIGITLFHIASQKFSTNKDYLVVQGMGFFNTYKKLRGADGVHEADYNIGRAYHQLGMLHLATEYYKKVLKVKNVLIDKYPNLFDLKKEAAYNLHLIYKASGAHNLAKMYLYKYIVV